MNAPAAGDQPDTLTVVIPALNEGASLRSVLEALHTECADIISEVVVVDDGSGDGTGDIAEAEGATVIRHPSNQGYGASLKSGFRHAETTYVATFDGDGQHRAADLRRLWEARAGVDMVVGSRERLLHSPLWRMPGKWVLGVVANRLAGRRIPDLNSGLRLVRKAAAGRYLHLCPSGFSMSTTLTMAMLSRGWRVSFVPIEVQPRRGHSTVTIATGLETLVLILRIVALFNPLRLFVPLSLLIFFVGVAWGVPFAVAGRGVSVGAMLAIVTATLLFSLGLLCDQVSQLRLERYE